MGGAFAVVVLVLANNMVLTMDSSPARSWDTPTVDDEDITFQMTFQTHPGDRLTLDLDRWLFNIGYRHYDAYEARLYETPVGNAGPDIGSMTPHAEASGVKTTVDTPLRKGTILDPDPPEWVVQSDSWWTIQIILDHGGRAPSGSDDSLMNDDEAVEQARYWYAQSMEARFVSDGPFGPLTSPIQVLPGAALRVQWLFNMLEAAAFAAMIAGAVLGMRNRPAGEGLEGKLEFAHQARQWLQQVSGQLWMAGAAIALLAFLLLFALEGAPLSVRDELQPDGWYLARTSLMIAATFLAVIVAWVLRMVRIRQALGSIPKLELDA